MRAARAVARALAVAAGLATRAGLAGCGESTAPVPRPGAPSGAYRLVSVDGAPLPRLVQWTDEWRLHLVAATLDFHRADSASWRREFRREGTPAEDVQFANVAPVEPLRAGVYLVRQADEWGPYADTVVVAPDGALRVRTRFALQGEPHDTYHDFLYRR